MAIPFDIGNVNAAAGFVGVVAGNQTIGNSDFRSIVGSKPSAAMVTVAIRAAEFSHSIIRDIATRNGHDAALGHNAATESHVGCAITGDYATEHVDFGHVVFRVFRVHIGAVSVHTAASRSAVTCDHATDEAEGGTFAVLDAKFDACALALRGCTANVATAHIDGRTFLGINQTVNTDIFLLRNHATLEIERTALVVGCIEINEFQVVKIQVVFVSTCHDGTADTRFMFIQSLGSTGAVRLNRRSSYIVGEIGGDIGIVVGHGSRVTIFAERIILANEFVASRNIHCSLLIIFDG